MSTSQQIRLQITDKIVKALEGNAIPWRRPWSISNNSGHPTNVVSKKGYTGINPLLLQLHAMQHGLTSKWWATFDQWKALGGVVQRRPSHVEAGAWGCHVVFYRIYDRTVTDKQTGQDVEKSFPLLRSYTVFNADQVDGEVAAKFRVLPSDAVDTRPNFEPVEQLIAISKADIWYGGDRAFYRRPEPEASWPNHGVGDYIQMPQRVTFPEQRDFYSTILHEFSHWAEVRAGWDHREHGYALGELAAEIGACFLTQELGIPGSDDLTNHVAYLHEWLRAMKGDPTFIFKAASQASKVSDFLLAFVRQEQQVEAA